MPRFLAIDWDGVEVRFVLGNQNKEKISVLKFGSAPLNRGFELAPTEDVEKNEELDDSVPESEAPKETFDIGADLQALLKSHGVGASTNLYALSNSQMDVMYLTLPPAKDEEIPELLKNQAIREFPNFSDSQPLDFLPLSDIPTEQRRILAVSQTKSQQKALQHITRSARRKPEKLEYRAAAVAAFSLYSKLLSVDSPPTLLLNVLCDELDLITVAGGQVINIRSVKLPELHGAELQERLYTEISRMLAIGLQDYSDESITHLQFFLGENEHLELLERLRRQSLEVSVVDPFSVALIRLDDLPQSPGRFTALLGMILSEAAGKKPAIDLLHPKSKPKPPNYAAFALVALVVFALGVWWLYSWNKKTLAQEQLKLDERKAVYAQLQTQYNQQIVPYTVLSNAAAYDKQDAVWLDVIRDITPHFPEQQDMIVNQMSYISGPIPQVRGGQYYSGRIDVNAMVREASVLTKLKQTLEEKKLYHVHIFTPTHNPIGGGYPWNCNFSIRCIRVNNPASYLHYQPEEIRAESQNIPERYPRPQHPQPVPAPSN